MRDSQYGYIAERRLLFAAKSSSIRSPFRVRVTAPRIVEQCDESFPVDGVIAKCHVEIDGINESAFDVYGMDSLQAINMASDIEPLLKRLGEKYDFFWLSGEPYFEE